MSVFNYSYRDGAFSGRGSGRKRYYVYDKKTDKYLGSIEGKGGDWRVERHQKSADHFEGPGHQTRDKVVEALLIPCPSDSLLPK